MIVAMPAIIRLPAIVAMPAIVVVQRIGSVFQILVVFSVFFFNVWHCFQCFFSLGEPWDALRGPLEGRRGTAGAPWGPLEGPRRHRRTSLGGPRGVLGVLGASLGRLWSALGATLGCLWSACRARSAPNASHSEVSEGVPGASLGRVCSALGGLCSVLGGSGGPWSDLGASLEPQRRSLERPGCVFGATAPARPRETHATHITPRCKHYVSLNTLY